MTCLAGVCRLDGAITLASGASDCTLKVWGGNSPSKFQLLQTLSFARGVVLGVALHWFHQHLFLACGCSEETVEVFVAQEDGGKVSPASITPRVSYGLLLVMLLAAVVLHFHSL